LKWTTALKQVGTSIVSASDSEKARSILKFSDAEYGDHPPVFRSKDPQTGPVQEDVEVSGAGTGVVEDPLDSTPSAASMRDEPRHIDDGGMTVQQQCEPTSSYSS
jgi:hypothetical protein